MFIAFFSIPPDNVVFAYTSLNAAQNLGSINLNLGLIMSWCLGDMMVSDLKDFASNVSLRNTHYTLRKKGTKAVTGAVPF